MGGERKEETVGGLVTQSVSQSINQPVSQSVSPLLECCIYMSQDYILSIRKARAGYARRNGKGYGRRRGRSI